MKARTQSDTPQPAAKLDVIIGIYNKGTLARTERYADLKTANKRGREWEAWGYQVMIRCGVSSLPDAYPYSE